MESQVSDQRIASARALLRDREFPLDAQLPLLEREIPDARTGPSADVHPVARPVEDEAQPCVGQLDLAGNLAGLNRYGGHRGRLETGLKHNQEASVRGQFRRHRHAVYDNLRPGGRDALSRGKDDAGIRLAAGPALPETCLLKRARHEGDGHQRRCATSAAVASDSHDSRNRMCRKSEKRSGSSPSPSRNFGFRGPVPNSVCPRV